MEEVGEIVAETAAYTIGEAPDAKTKWKRILILIGIAVVVIVIIALWLNR
jgi:membrane protein DedA with SNARE-associated domain